MCDLRNLHALCLSELVKCFKTKAATKHTGDRRKKEGKKDRESETFPSPLPPPPPPAPFSYLKWNNFEMWKRQKSPSSNSFFVFFPPTT